MSNNRQRKEVPPVNCANDEECVFLGIRTPKVSPRVESLWRKTDKEKKLIKKFKRQVDSTRYQWAPPMKQSTYVGMLIVHVKNYPKSTYTVRKCPNLSVPFVVGRFGDNVIKAYFNGKLWK